jgi:hypothetical protein
MDRKMVKAGDFLVSGPPAAGQSLTKVFVIETAEDLEAADREFDAMERAVELAKRTRKALEALTSK